MDIMQREDRYPYPLLPESGNIMGVEFSGTVEERGAGCKNPISSLVYRSLTYVNVRH